MFEKGFMKPDPKFGTASAPEGAPQEHILSVSDFIGITNDALRRFGTALVQGEISEAKMYNHLYFKIKDEDAVLSCLIYSNVLRSLKFRPEVGMQVIVEGSSSIWPKNGSYSFVVRSMRPAGRGEIMQRLEELRERLRQEGVFDRLNRTIPRFIDRVGVITSKEGAVLHDITSTLERRNPHIRIIVYPAKVQGEQAPQSLMEALNLAYENNEADVLIIGRGGGSFEDLLAFSDEALVRTVAHSPIPIISAVGHETDFSLCDYAADVRAETPTAAAEMVSTVLHDDIMGWLGQYESNLTNAILNQLSHLKMQLDTGMARLEAAGTSNVKNRRIALERQLSRLNESMNAIFRRHSDRLAALERSIHSNSPESKFNHSKQRLSDANLKLGYAIDRIVSACRERLGSLEGRVVHGNVPVRLEKLDKQWTGLNSKIIALNPLGILERGYSYTTYEDSGRVLDGKVKEGDRIRTQLSFGEITGTVGKVTLKQK